MQELSIYLIIASLVLNLALLVWVIRLQVRLGKFTKGANGSNLESLINQHQVTLKNLESDRDAHREDIRNLKLDIMKTLQRIGVVRFNPFKDMGGNQSFAIALIDKNNDGLVLSSLYTRERVNVFAKPIENGISSFPLTKEEEEAIKQAQA